MLSLIFDAEGLDAAEHCSESFHVGQGISGLDVEPLDLAAFVKILRIMEARCGHGHSRRSDLCPLIFFSVFGVEESYSSEVSPHSQHNKDGAIHT